MTEGKVAVVTGAGSGIGRAVAIGLAARGYRLALIGRDAARLAETQVAGGTGPEGSMVLPTDIRSAAEVETSIAAVRDRWGRIDLLFNNAGTFGPTAAFEDLSVADIDDVVATNLVGSILVAQAAYRAMKDQKPQGGRIINNGSISAHAPRPNSALYTSTKHAMTGLTKALSLDGRRYDIACGQIDIGNAATAMTAAISEGALQANGERMVEPTIDVGNIVRAVLMMADLPLDANVQFMTVMATAMPFVGRG